MSRFACVFVLFSLILSGQARMSMDQLRSFMKSSIDLHHPDKQVAEYLKKTKLTERLAPAQFEEFIGLGAGARTIEALRDLMEASKSLPVPTAKQPKPAVATIPPPSPEDQRRIIEEARAYAMAYTKNLPDFLCMQVTRRYADPSGLEFWQRQDVINTRLSYVDDKEEYKVITVNGRMADVQLHDVGGATSTGEFGTMMKELFDSSTHAKFNWQRWATLRGRRSHVFEYYVAQPNSKFTVSYERRQFATVGYRGLVFVDRDTLQVTRITFDGEMPPDFPVQQTSTVLDYDLIDISGSKFMLPLKAEMRMRDGKTLMKNETEFRMYRKFSADAVITFDTPEPLPDSETKEQPPQ